MKLVTIELIQVDTQTGYLPGSRRVVMANAAGYLVKRGIAKIVDSDSNRPQVERRKAKRTRKPAGPVDGDQGDTAATAG